MQIEISIDKHEIRGTIHGILIQFVVNLFCYEIRDSTSHKYLISKGMFDINSFYTQN